jgi:acyl-CoA synthetase (AMP-forming)/AMP-acid ligase II
MNDAVTTKREPDVADRLRDIFALDPNAPALEFQDRWYTYAHLQELMGEVAALAGYAGSQEGLPVGILLRNSPGMLAAALETVMHGHTIVTVNPMQPLAPLCADIERLHVPVIVAEARDWEQAELRQAAERGGSRGISVSLSIDGLRANLIEGLPGSSATASAREFTPGIAVEMLSSGTTGTPKRIRLARRSLSRSLYAGARYESGDPDETRLRTSAQIAWTPLVHIAGLWNAIYGLYNGRRLALMERFDLDLWHSALVRHRPRFASFPPSALRMVLERDFPKEDFTSLLAVRSGTAPLDPELARRFEEHYGVPVLEAYGATEFAGGVAGWSLADHKRYAQSKRSSVGRANAGVELRVVDQNSFMVLAAGQVGLLEVRTQQVGDGKEWIRTTDLARLDADGFLYIVGRADGAILRGGFKILPEPVEVALRTHPAVLDATVVGIADERLGQVPVAALEASAGVSKPSDDELASFLKARLKAYEVPVAFLWVDALPRTPSMKVKQPAVRELFLKENLK